MTEADRAQTWHDTDHGSCEAGSYSSCWCCCTICDPDWGHLDAHSGTPRPNPYFEAAQKEIAGGC